MKFGAYLAGHLRPDWKDQYIDYKRLKTMIRVLSEVENRAIDVPEGNSGSGERVTSLTMIPNLDVRAKFNGDDITENVFFKALEDEMNKVDTFTLKQMTELKGKVDEIADVVFKTDESAEQMSEIKRKELIKQAKGLGDQFLLLEKYVNLNYLGFHKILKKHDKQLPIPCQRFYMTRLHDQNWIKHDYSKMFVVLSKIHAKLRGDVAAKDEGLSGQSFVRTTTKYWVRTADISRVKHIILQNLPVFQHKLDVLHGDSQLTNSVYFDNTQMELYHGRLDKLPNAIAIRFRWYETDDPELVFVERKTHFDSWTGDESVKERFTLHESQVLPFLKGEYTVHDKLKEMRKKNKSEKDINNVEKLFQEIYNQIDSKQLRPTLRTQYMRVAYQVPFDATVRISLDTNLCMIAENPKVGPDCLTAGRWYRDPSIPLPPTEFTLFPHAILEVKLSLKKDQAVPDWVNELTKSGLVTRVHKFSKFIHGCATLLSKSVQAVPYWVDDESIRASMLRALPNDSQRKVKFETPKAKAKKKHLLQFGERENFQLMPRRESITNYGSYTDERSLSISEMNAEQTELQNRDTSNSKKSSKSGAFGAGVYSYLESLLGLRKRGDYYYDKLAANDYNVKNRDTYKVRKTPMRIEPKVFFANERTFLSWVHMSITLGSISAVLLGFGEKNNDEWVSQAGDSVPQPGGGDLIQIVGLILLPVSILFVAYALTVFYWRARHIRDRVDNDMFHDPVGPLVLGMVLFGALSSIFVLFLYKGKAIKI